MPALTQLSDKFISDPADWQDRLAHLLQKVKQEGATDGEVQLGESVAYDNQVRYAKPINLDHSETRDLALRAYVGKRKADISVSLDRDQDWDELAARVVAMAKLSPEDPYCGLAEQTAGAKQIATHTNAIDVYDDAPPLIERLGVHALEMESAALSHKGISNSEGASASWRVGQTIALTTQNFYGVEKATSYSFGCSVLAEKDGVMERDYDFATAHFASDLPPPQSIGDSAAKRTLARCGAHKPKSTKAQVVFSPRVSASLLGHFASAISGANVARQTSFLKNALGKKIFNAAITITDDPFRKRGLRSQAFDSEGVLSAKQNFIQDGVLQNFLLDSSSARQLGRTNTGNAGGITNFFLDAASPCPTADALLARIGDGFYITELIGAGVNIVTGDYSRGAAGFLIKNGKVGQPVNEMTIVGNLRDIFLNLSAADDLTFRYGVDAPTLCLGELTIAGA